MLASFYKPDFLCFGEVVVEAKALRETGNAETAQVLNYLKAGGREIGLLVNFGRPSLEYRRFIRSAEWRQTDNSPTPEFADEAAVAAFS